MLVAVHTDHVPTSRTEQPPPKPGPQPQSAHLSALQALPITSGSADSSFPSGRCRCATRARQIRCMPEAGRFVWRGGSRDHQRSARPGCVSRTLTTKAATTASSIFRGWPEGRSEFGHGARRGATPQTVRVMRRRSGKSAEAQWPRPRCFGRRRTEECDEPLSPSPAPSSVNGPRPRARSAPRPPGRPSPRSHRASPSPLQHSS
jgi:hypothetical protein